MFPPDWKDPSQYPDPKKTSGKQWAWEFLRRNPQYQNNFNEVINLPKKRAGNFLLNDPASYIWNPERKYFKTKKEYETFDKYIARLQRSGLKFNPPIHKKRFYADKWGVKRMVSPEEDDYNIVEFYKSLLPVRLMKSPDDFENLINEGIDREEIYPNEIILGINLERSVESNICEIKRIIQEKKNKLDLRNKVIRKERNYFSRYLRILDARALGISYQNIGKIIFKNEDPENAKRKSANGYQAASKISQSGYLNLLSVTN